MLLTGEQLQIQQLCEKIAEAVIWDAKAIDGSKEHFEKLDLEPSAETWQLAASAFVSVLLAERQAIQKANDLWNMQKKEARPC